MGLIVACIAPLSMRWDIGVSRMVSTPSQLNTLVATAIAVVLGFFVVRRLTRYPGVAGISYILPTFTVTFGLALGIFVFLRLDYSRFFLFASFVNAQIWFHLIYVISRKTSKPVFAVVPFGNTPCLTDIGDVSWRFLSQPQLDGPAPNGLTADLRANHDDDWEAFIAETAISGIPVYHYKQIRETLTGRVEIEHLSENNLGSLLPSFIYLRFKQWIDIAAAVVMFPVLLPLFFLIGVCIKLDSKGPVFFRQERMGFRGRVFRVWKFRTMTHGPTTGSLDRTNAITRDSDPRITRLGRLLRKTRLDELPQVINVLNGEMSWIGPRPEAVSLSRWYEEELPFYRYRHIVRPGITGWAQVNQGHVAEVDEVRSKLHYDFYYIKNFSIWLDTLIAIRTLAIVVSGFGAK
ncbi:sugar transferase [Hoeflea sp. TYP-13]|uniref:sugar transferase n=1 Tax=Hoeflea sp. TYP-13 TaxID=3230023 RepID=UPI0034C61738